MDASKTTHYKNPDHVSTLGRNLKTFRNARALRSASASSARLLFSDRSNTPAAVQSFLFSPCVQGGAEVDLRAVSACGGEDAFPKKAAMFVEICPFLCA